MILYIKYAKLWQVVMLILRLLHQNELLSTWHDCLNLPLRKPTYGFEFASTCETHGILMQEENS